MTSRKKKIFRISILVIVLIVAGLYLYKVGAEVTLVDKENVTQLYLSDVNRSRDYDVSIEEFDRIVEYFNQLTLIPIVTLPRGGTSYVLQIHHTRGQIQSIGITGDGIISIGGKKYMIIRNKNERTVSDFMDSLDKEYITYE